MATVEGISLLNEVIWSQTRFPKIYWITGGCVCVHAEGVCAVRKACVQTNTNADLMSRARTTSQEWITYLIEQLVL